jgi:hypothetical protein
MKMRRPSPAMVVAVAALIVALCGTAVAGGVLNKKRVNKIITRRAPGLGVGNSARLEGKPAASFASSASEGWHEVGAPGEPAYQNGWTHGGLSTDSTAAFFKDPLGIVHLKGVLHSNTGSLTAFTLPAGYAPSQGLFLPAATTPGTATLTIEIDGSVKPLCSTAPCTVGIDGLSFRP